MHTAETTSEQQLTAEERPPFDPPDTLLIERWLSQADRPAISQLVQRYLRPIRGFVGQMTLDWQAADDLAQEVFLRAIRSLSQFRHQCEFSTWLFQIAKNVARTYLDQSGRRSQVRSAAPRQQVMANHNAPDAVAMSREHVQQIEDALQTLSTPLREAIVLTCLHGMSAEQAALISGCQPGTIYSRVHSARSQLKTRLKDLLP